MKDYIIFLISLGIIPTVIFSLTWSPYIMGSSLFFTLLIGGICLVTKRFFIKSKSITNEEEKQAV